MENLRRDALNRKPLEGALKGTLRPTERKRTPHIILPCLLWRERTAETQGWMDSEVSKPETSHQRTPDNIVRFISNLAIFKDPTQVELYEERCADR